MNKAVFLDRDGTINLDFGYVYRIVDLVLLPGVIDALKIFQENGYLLVVITNQSGIGRGLFSLDQMKAFNNQMNLILKKHGLVIQQFYVCPHSPDENCSCRKPSSYLVDTAIRDFNIDRNLSFFFGDKLTDIECGQNAGIKSFLVTREKNLLYWAKYVIV